MQVDQTGRAISSVAAVRSTKTSLCVVLNLLPSSSARQAATPGSGFSRPASTTSPRSRRFVGLPATKEMARRPTIQDGPSL